MPDICEMPNFKPNDKNNTIVDHCKVSRHNYYSLWLKSDTFQFEMIDYNLMEENGEIFEKISRTVEWWNIDSTPIFGSMNMTEV